MKLKGLSKIAIAGAALAATAATLGTSTYAWYVSNIEATATGVVAQMQDSTGGSVYISKNGSKFYSNITFVDGDFNTGEEPNNVNDDLFPITTADAVDFTSDDDAAVTGNKLVVTMWLKADSDITVQPRLGVTNNSTASAVQQTLYADVNNDHLSGSTMAMDAVEALRMAVFVDSTATGTIYDVKSIAKNPSALDTAYSTPSGFVGALTSSSENAALGAAHAYYKDVTGEEPTHTSAATPTTSWGTISLTANTAKKLKFVFWLEGADTECFDSCAGQNISFLFDFVLAS